MRYSLEVYDCHVSLENIRHQCAALSRDIWDLVLISFLLQIPFNMSLHLIDFPIVVGLSFLVYYKSISC